MMSSGTARSAASVDPASQILRQFVSEARRILAIGEFGEEVDELPGVILDQVVEPWNAVLTHTWVRGIVPHLAEETLPTVRRLPQLTPVRP